MWLPLDTGGLQHLAEPSPGRESFCVLMLSQKTPIGQLGPKPISIAKSDGVLLDQTWIPVSPWNKGFQALLVERKVVQSPGRGNYICIFPFTQKSHLWEAEPPMQWQTNEYVCPRLFITELLTITKN